MKLVFVCTSLEPGRDGVGDYARQLAVACTEMGVECRLIALNDEHVSTPIEESQQVGPHLLACLRLPPTESWPTRAAIAGAFVDAFGPDWVSWQIVPYGFHPKGIIPTETRVFNMLGRGRHVHVMLHELWIGLARGEPLKNRLYGRAQRGALMNFLQELEPALVDTSNVVYQSVLAQQGCVATVIPLFGNIPIAPTPPGFGVVDTEPATATRRKTWVGTIFGTVHPQFKARPCFDALVAGAKASWHTLRILGVGRLGSYGEEMLAQLPALYPGEVETEILGEKTWDEVSRLLQLSQFGIATHPWALLGKSGAVAAMLDHGLPVVVPRDDWELRKRPEPVPAIDRLVVKLENLPAELMAGWVARKRPPASRLPAVASTFLSRLGVGIASPTPTA
jgi:hypothetical protein